MAAYCGGDASAFRELYARVSPRLFNYLLRLGGDRALAEDLLQQTFLKAHRARHSYVLGAPPLPWLYAIAHRTFLDETRRRRRAPLKLTGEVAAGLASSAAPEEPGVDPELLGAALAALEGLPARQREALVLTKLHGKSIKEAAEITGSTVGAMKVRAHRAYQALRKALAPRVAP